MKRSLLSLSIFSLVAVTFSGCGLFRSNNEKGLSSAAEFSSSSSDIIDTGRVEIEYSDTLRVGDSLAYLLPDSLNTWNLYLGKFPKGTLVHVALRAGALDATAKFRIKTELGSVQLPTNRGIDSTYQEYVQADSAKLLPNYVVLMDSDYYYLEVKGTRKAVADSIPAFYATIVVDTAFYQFTGSEDSLVLPSNKDLEGCFRLDRGEDSTTYFFGASAGRNLTLVSTGQNLAGVLLQEKGSTDTIGYAVSALSHQLLPTDSTLWQVNVHTVIPAWNSGNYAFFTLHLSSLQLGQGEYFAKPDTMPRPGDTLKVDRVGSENSGWDVRHDHYVYLGTLAKGETIQLFYGMQGLTNVSKMAFILDSQGNPVDTLDQVATLNWSKEDPSVFVAPAAGAYTLHYRGLGSSNTAWADSTFPLHLRALVQKPGLLGGWDYDPPSFTMAPGETLSVAEALVFKSILPVDASRNYRVLLPRADRAILQDSIDIAYTSQGTATPTGDQVLSSWLRAPASGSGIAHLLIQSVADPTRIDTCLITVSP